MRIAVYYDLPNGGAMRSMEAILPLLSSQHQVSIFSTSENSRSFLHRVVADMYCFTLARYNQYMLAKKINTMDFDFVLVTHDRYLQSPWLLRYLKKPSIFICQEPTRALFENFLKTDPSLPAINKLYENTVRALRRYAEIKNASYATATIANSFYSAESIFRSYGVSANVCHLGVDTSIFYPTKTKKINQVLVVGNNEPQKALSFAVESVALIGTKKRPTLAIACPRNNDLTEIKRLAKKLKVDLEIKTGLSSSELTVEYNRSKLTLACAYLEPFGLSVVESIACGTPVVAVSEGGFRETVIDGVNGVLTARNKQQFSDAVSMSLEDKKLRDSTEKTGSDYITINFSWKRMLEKINSIANDVC